MPFEADLVAHLSSASIVAVVGDRMFPLTIQEGADKPAITYQRVIGTPLNDLDGLDGGLMEIREQIDCYARSFTVARALAELVRVRLQTPAATFYAVTNFDQDFYEDDVKLYRCMLDCSFWFRIS